MLRQLRGTGSVEGVIVEEPKAPVEEKKEEGSATPAAPEIIEEPSAEETDILPSTDDESVEGEKP